MVLCAFNTMLVTQPKKRADILRCHHCMVYPWKDVWETSTEILYWWCVTTQMALLIGHAMWEIASTNQRNHTDLGSDESSVWNFCACFSGVISQGNQWCVAKCRLFAQAVVSYAAILVSSRNVIVFLPKEREGALRDETKTAVWDWD